MSRVAPPLISVVVSLVLLGLLAYMDVRVNTQADHLRTELHHPHLVPHLVPGFNPLDGGLTHQDPMGGTPRVTLPSYTPYVSPCVQA